MRILPSERAARLIPPHLVCAATQSLTLEEAKLLALKILKQVMEEKLDENNVQLAFVTPKQRFSIVKKDELKGLVEQTETAAAAAEASAAQAGSASTSAEVTDAQTS